MRPRRGRSGLGLRITANEIGVHELGSPIPKLMYPLFDVAHVRSLEQISPRERGEDVSHFDGSFCILIHRRLSISAEESLSEVEACVQNPRALAPIGVERPGTPDCVACRPA